MLQTLLAVVLVGSHLFVTVRTQGPDESTSSASILSWTKDARFAANVSSRFQEVSDRRLNAPTVSVTNVRYTDTQAEGGKIAGVIEWDPPASWPDEGHVRRYRPYILNSPFDADLLYSSVQSYLWYSYPNGDFQDSVPYGTNQYTIHPDPAGVQRKTYISGQPVVEYANFLAVLCMHGSVPATSASLDATAVTPIYDLCSNCDKPGIVIDTTQADGGIQFTDGDGALGVISGTISWTLAELDRGYVEFFKVYLATDDQGSNLLPIDEAVPMSSSPSVTFGSTNRQSRDFIWIITSNSQAGDSTVGVAKALYDENPGGSVTVQVENLAFTDNDNRENYIQGQVTWSRPEDVAPFLAYEIYFAMDAQGTGRVHEATVSAGFSSYTIPFNTERQSMDYLLVYTRNSIPGDAGLSANPAFVRIADLTNGPPSEKVASVSFSDSNAHYRVIDGTISWVPGDEGAVTNYQVFLSATTSGVDTVASTFWVQLGTAVIGTNELVVPSSTSLQHGAEVLSYIQVYAANADPTNGGRSSNFHQIAIIDWLASCTNYGCPVGFGAKPDAPAGCSGTSCTDEECCQASGQCGAFSCPATWTTKATPPAYCSGFTCQVEECCDRGAEAPGNLTASSPGHASVVLVWEVPVLHDCIFREYEVQWRSLADPYTNFSLADGCTDLRDVCFSQCTATGLPSQTSIEFQARAVCVVENTVDLSSDWSGTDEGVATLPHRAEAPINVNVYGISTTSASVSWQAGNLNDCNLLDWTITVQTAASGQVVYPQRSCSTQTNCLISGLSCITSYNLQVAASCSNSLANGPTSVTQQFTTLRGLDCVEPATLPVVVVSGASESTIQVAWTAGTAGDCEFTSWAVEVRPQNSATWSQPPGCIDLTTRQAAQCTATGLQSNILHEFRVREECNNTFANSEWGYSASLQTLVRPADAPANVASLSPTPFGMLVQWDVPSMHDCLFSEYIVQWRATDDVTSTWALPAGCTGLQSACESLCTASGLPANTSVEFQIRVACQSSDSNSAWSGTSSPVSTLPHPADQPTGVAVETTSSTRATVSWTAGDLRHCIFDSWTVIVLDLATNQVVQPQPGCIGLGWETTSCQVENLACDTLHSATVAVSCADPDASSLPSTAVTFTTSTGTECILPATPPTSLAATANASPQDSFDLSWLPGEARDCNFVSWGVEVRPSNLAAWTTATGCTGLTSRTTVACTATGLQSNTLHEFRVKEECTDVNAASAWALLAAPVRTAARPAAPPTGTQGNNPTQNSIAVHWEVATTNDCIFRRYVVEWRVAADSSAPWLEPAGCMQVTSACSSTCTATGLPSNTEVIFRVAVSCVAADLDSGFGSASTALATLPQPAGAPASVSVPGSDITETNATVLWQAPSLNDCVFSKWSVLVTSTQSGETVAPQAVCDEAGFATTACLVTGLSCSTQYSIQISVECVGARANSALSTPVDFRTLDGEYCLAAATRPTTVSGTEQSFTTMRAVWLPGQPNDCIFQRWHVQFRVAGSSDPLFVPQGCMDLTSRAVSTCLATGLLENTSYNIHVEEVCSNPLLSSGDAISSFPVSTRVVPPAEVLLQDPLPGSAATQRPDQVLLIFSENVELNRSAILRIRSEDTAGPCTLDNQSSAADFRLQNSRIALWSVDRSLWRQGCQYQLEVDAGLFVTRQEPRKAVPSLLWNFTYNATVPSLVQVSLQASTSSSLTVSVAWDLGVVLRCGAMPLGSNVSGDLDSAFVSPPTEMRAFKDELVTISFTDLIPAEVYAVYCMADLQEDRLVQSPWLLTGSWETPADTNRLLSTLSVTAIQECPDGTTASPEVIPLSPAFDSQETTYQAVVATADPLTACGGSLAAGGASVWRISVAGGTASAYASLTMTWSGGEEISDSLRRLRLPAGAAFAEINSTLTVSPMAIGVEPLLYSLAILAMQVQFQLGTPRVYDSTGVQVSLSTAMQEGWKLEVDVSYTGVRGEVPMDFWSRLSVYVGPFSQQTTVLTGAAGQQTYTLQVANLLGLGRDLPVQVRLEGAVMGQAAERVSFVEPAISCVSTDEATTSCDPNSPVVVDTVNETTLFATGYGFGTHPTLFQNTTQDQQQQAVRLSVSSLSSSAPSSNLCKESRWVSNRRLMCILDPQVPPPLQLEIWGPRGDQIEQLLLVQWDVEYKSPALFSAWPEVLPLSPSLSGQTDLYLVGESFPNFTVGDLDIQLLSDPATNRRLSVTDQVDTAQGRILAQAGSSPCKQVVRVNSTHLLCRLQDYLNIASVGCQNPVILVNFGGLQVRLQLGLLEVPSPNVTGVMTSDMVEVGSNLTYHLMGYGFGSAANGPLRVQVGDRNCWVETRNDSFVTCQVNGPLRDDLEPEYPEPLVFNSSAGHSVIEIMVDIPVRAALGYDQPGCAPIADTWQQHQVNLLACSPGFRRTNKSTAECVPCERGRFQRATGPFLSCRACDVGTYQDEEGQTACQTCPAFKTTVSVGSSDLTQCQCAVGNFLPMDSTTPASPCTPCPRGAACPGGAEPPFALGGHWLHSDLSVTPCTFVGCLGNNTCSDGYMEEARCENCEVNWYPDIFDNACRQCSTWVPFVTWTYLVAAILFICFVIVPLIAWKARRELNPELTEVPWICCGALRGLLTAVILGINDSAQVTAATIKVTDEMPWPRTRRAMMALKCMEWPKFRSIIEGAEFQRVVNILVNNTQILYLVAGIGVRYWPGAVQDFMLHLSYVLGDVESLKPDCFMSLSAPNRWFMMFCVPYFLYGIFMIAVSLQSSRRVRNRGPILAMISGAALLYLFPLHLMTIMQAFDCIQINDSKRSWVLDIDRSVYCYNYFGSENQDTLWSVMATVAGVDLVFLCLLMFFVGRSVYRSFWWYREQELGSPPPKSVFLTWWWVVGCRGFSAKHRYAVRGLKTQLATSTMHLTPPKVGGLCEDLFSRNLAELQSSLGSMASDLKSSHLWPFLEALDQSADTGQKHHSNRDSVKEAVRSLPRGAWVRNSVRAAEHHTKGKEKASSKSLAPWERRQRIRRNAYMALSAQLDSISASWRTMSSFATHETASLLSYMWELVIAVNKLGLAFIRVYTSHDPGIGMRAACFWSLFFTVLVISVQPYRHDGLNFLECTFSALISFAIASVLVLELWEDESSQTGTDGIHLFFQVLNFILVVSVLILAAVMLVAWLYYYIRDLAFKDFFYVLDPDNLCTDWGCRESFSSVRSDCHAEANTDNDPKQRVVSRVVMRKSEVVEKGEELEAQWMFCSAKLPGTTQVELDQGMGITVRDEPLLHRILDAEGGPISMAEPLPGEMQGLKNCGEFHLTRGGDLTGLTVLRLNGKLEQNLAELWKLQERNSDFVLPEPLRVAGKTVPAGATLRLVRFAPPGTPEHLAKSEYPEDFLHKLVAAGDSGLHGVQGLLILEFLRPDTAEDRHLELCELILSRDEVPDDVVGRENSALSQVEPCTATARQVAATMVLPLELRLAPPTPKVQLSVFKEPGFGFFDKVLILGRHGQQWLVRASELDLRLGNGLQSEEEEETQTSNEKRRSQAGTENNTGHEGFVKRSVWRTRDGGIVVIHNSNCWGGNIDLEKPEEAYHVEMGELYGIPVQWRPEVVTAQDPPITGWFDGESINWFENGLSDTDYLLADVDGPARKLPPSPWVRVRNAAEEGGVPGQDGGLWKLVTYFYTQCNGPLPHAQIDRLTAFQAGAGARELFLRTMEDSLLEKTQMELIVPNLSAAAVLGPPVRENTCSTISYTLGTPRGQRPSTSAMRSPRSRDGASPRSPYGTSREGTSPTNGYGMRSVHSTFSDLWRTSTQDQAVDRPPSAGSAHEFEVFTPRQTPRQLPGIDEGPSRSHSAPTSSTRQSPPSGEQRKRTPSSLEDGSRNVLHLGEESWPEPRSAGVDF